jgi:hypothetical protein
LKGKAKRGEYITDVLAEIVRCARRPRDRRGPASERYGRPFSNAPVYGGVGAGRLEYVERGEIKGMRADRKDEEETDKSGTG